MVMLSVLRYFIVSVSFDPMEPRSLVSNGLKKVQERY